MKTIRLLISEEPYTITGSEWFIVCTDKLMSRSRPDGKTHKRVYICLNGHGKAAEFAERMKKPKYELSYIRVTPNLPYFSPSKYSVSYEFVEDNLWNY